VGTIPADAHPNHGVNPPPHSGFVMLMQEELMMHDGGHARRHSA
jgi:hypothetical protein